MKPRANGDMSAFTHEEGRNAMGVGYRVMDNWGSGFIGEMTVTAGFSALHGWTIEFDAPFAIANLWNAEIVSHVGNHYVIRNAAWISTG